MLTTTQKILIARIASSFVRSIRSIFGLSSRVVATRDGIAWSLDLTEGIDFSIYILGGFEVSTLKKYAKFVHNGHTVLDIGANIGAHTLPLAKLVGDEGRVLAFEPTKYAFTKMQTNISLNEKLAKRIDAQQIMLVCDTETSVKPDSIYSSWPLETANDLNTDHLGRLMSTHGATLQTIDQMVSQKKMLHVDFIKLDVDGNELSVLKGAESCLNTFAPTIMMELAPYVYRDKPEEFDCLLNLLFDHHYCLMDAATEKLLPNTVQGIKSLIPDGCGKNILATKSST